MIWIHCFMLANACYTGFAVTIFRTISYFSNLILEEKLQIIIPVFKDTKLKVKNICISITNTHTHADLFRIINTLSKDITILKKEHKKLHNTLSL